MATKIKELEAKVLLNSDQETEIKLEKDQLTVKILEL